MPYTASHGVGPRLPVVNRRVLPTEGSDYITRIDTIQIVAHPDISDVGYVRLYERPLSSQGGGGDVSVTDVSSGDQLQGTITFPPGVNNFYVAPYQGLVFFNSSRIGNTVSISYIAMGSIIDGLDINYIFELAKPNKFLSPDITILANNSYELPEYIVTEVYLKLEENRYKLVTSADNIDVELWYPDSFDNYKSIIVNNNANDVVIRFRATKKFTEPA